MNKLGKHFTYLSWFYFDFNKLTPNNTQRTFNRNTPKEDIFSDSVVSWFLLTQLNIPLVLGITERWGVKLAIPCLFGANQWTPARNAPFPPLHYKRARTHVRTRTPTHITARTVNRAQQGFRWTKKCALQCRYGDVLLPLALISFDKPTEERRLVCIEVCGGWQRHSQVRLLCSLKGYPAMNGLMGSGYFVTLDPFTAPFLHSFCFLMTKYFFLIFLIYGLTIMTVKQ